MNNVQVDLQFNVNAQSIVEVFEDSPQPLTNVIVFPEFTLPINRLYESTAAGGSLFRFQGQDNQIVGELDDVFATNENKALLKADLQRMISSYCVARDINYDINNLSIIGSDNLATPFSNYTNSQHYSWPNNIGVGGLILSVYAHYLFGHAQATAAISNDTTIISNILSDADGTPRIAENLANSVYSMIQFDASKIVKQVLGQDASRATNVDNDLSDPAAWQQLKWLEGDIIFMQLTVQPPTVVIGSDPTIDVQQYLPASAMTEPVIYNMKIVVGPSDLLRPEILMYDQTKAYPTNLDVVNTYNTDISNIYLQPINFGAEATYSVSPVLPTGLSLDTATGVISGVPRTTFDFSKYEITATNSKGSAQASVILKTRAAPNAVWADTYAGFTAVSMEKDSLGNLYVLGWSTAQVTIASLSLTIPINSVILMKYNLSGTLLWCKYFTLPSIAPTPVKVCVNSSKNPVIFGHYRSSTVINVNPDASVTLPITTGTGAQNGLFIIEYNQSGTALWSYNINTNNGITCASGYVDNKDNLYVSGRHWNGAAKDLGNSVFLPGGNGNQTYTLKLNSSRVPQACKAYGFQLVFVRSFLVDSDDNIYLSGNFRSSTNTLINSDGSVILTPSSNAGGTYDSFFIKCNSLLVASWAKELKGTSEDSHNHMIFDQNNNIIITGFYSASSNIDLNGNSSVILPTTAGAGPDIFVVKFTINGVALWAKRIATNATQDFSNYAAIDSYNNIYITGSYINTTGTLTVAGETVPNTSNLDVICVKYDTNGNELAVKTFAATGSENSRAIVIDSNNNFYILGTYASTSAVNLNGDSSVVLPISTFSSFLIRYGENTTTPIAFPTFTTTLSDIMSEFNLAEVPVGETLQLIVNPLASNIVANWLSSDLTKATVSSTGVVTGVAAGTVTITAWSGSYSTTKIITVVAARTLTGNATITGTNVTSDYVLSNAPAGVYWFSSNKSVFTINSTINTTTVRIRTVAAGTATLYVLANKRLYSRTITVV